MTGFECFTTVVIRRAKACPAGCGPPLAARACLGISMNLMSLPIEHVRLNPSFHAKIDYYREANKFFQQKIYF
jgi:hypothetical protein